MNSATYNRCDEPGWVRVGRYDSCRRRAIWVRRTDSSDLEVCCGREGDDSYMVLTEDNPFYEVVSRALWAVEVSNYERHQRGLHCVPQELDLIVHRIGTPEGHEWGPHPKFKGYRWVKCKRCGCSRHSVVESGWGVAVSYFPTRNTETKAEPVCIAANNRCAVRADYSHGRSISRAMMVP